MSSTEPSRGPLKNLIPAVIITGLLAGALDAVAAITNFLVQGGKNPASIFKYIASGVFGKKAFAGGLAMIAWGVFFHFLITFGLTIFYYWLYPKVKWLGENKIVAGLLYGIFAWVITTRVIVPLSRIPQPPFDLSKALVAILILMCFIGLPISLLANKHYLYKK